MSATQTDDRVVFTMHIRLGGADGGLSNVEAEAKVLAALKAAGVAADAVVCSSWCVWSALATHKRTEEPDPSDLGDSLFPMSFTKSALAFALQEALDRSADEGDAWVRQRIEVMAAESQP